MGLRRGGDYEEVGMGVVDVEELLRELSGDSSCGPDLEYDPDYGALERAAQGKPEQQMGDTMIPAEEPDWGAVRDLAEELLGRSKDLRLGRYLAESLAHTSGFAGLHDGLAVLRGLLERYWDEVHPQLDPEDDNDPTLRMNTLSALCAADGMLACVRRSPLVQSRGLGAFSLRDVQLATGVLEAPSGEESVPNIGAIHAAFGEAPLDEVQASATVLEGSVAHLEAIDEFLSEQVGAAQAPNLKPLLRLLGEARSVVSEQLTARIGTESEAAAEGGMAVLEAPLPHGGGGSGRGPTVASGAIQSREDVVRVLDRICEFYERNEPSSPVPILLQRAKSLVFKRFMDIVRDLAPDGLHQVEAIRGSEDSGGPVESGGEEQTSQSGDAW